MATFKSIAREVLQAAGAPLHVSELTKRALATGLVTEGKTPEATMNAVLITDINTKKEESEFSKTGPSTFGLNSNRHIILKVPTFKVILPNLNLSSKQKGDIAEARIAELIILYSKNPGLSCYRPVSDDEGIDLIVKKRGEFKSMFIQVKSRFGVDSKLAFTATVKSKTVVDNYSMGLVFCYFDLVKGDIWDFLWFIPAPDFLKLANKLNGGAMLGFVSGTRRSELNKWDQYLIEKQELGNSISDQMRKM